MRVIGVLCVLGVFACNSDKFTDIPSISQFFFVRMTPEAAAIAVGETQQVTVTAYDAGPCTPACTASVPGNPIPVEGVPTFKSTDTTKVKVSSAGVVTAIAPGSASVIATLQNIPGVTSGISVTLADTTVFTVTAAPVAVGNLALSGRATGTPNTVGAGSTLALTTTITDANGAAVTGVGRPQFYSTNASVATVSSTGVVSGLNPGNTTIFGTITVGGVTKTASYDVLVTRPIAATISACREGCQTAALTTTPVVFIPSTFTVSATQAIVEGKAGAIVTFTVPNNTFSATSTPTSTECVIVTFADPSAAGAVAPSTNSGNIGTGGVGSTNPPLCSNAGTTTPAPAPQSQARLFTTPGTYTYTNTTNGATGTIIVE
jgi:hypothetical protein